MAYNKNIDVHQQWIGYLNPTGLVFSPQALDDAQVVINNTVVAEQKEFARHICIEKDGSFTFKGLDNCRSLFIDVFDWRDTDLDQSTDSIANYSFKHLQFEDVVSPTHIAKVNDSQVILIKAFDSDTDFDKSSESEDSWNSSIHFKFERLLREKHVSTGIILSKNKLRLIFAPRGESSGFIDFPFHIMYQPSGRLIFAAFNELFSATKVFNSPKNQSLIEILELSRKYQAKVSVALSGQVLAALYELLRGFQAANDEDNGKLLKETLETSPQEIYEGLLTVLLRMVFIMYSEDRNLLATDEVYQSSYSLAGLFERLRQDEAQNPDTMDSRYGAWAQLLSLFRLVYDGAEYDSEKGKVILPARHGHLFDPNKYLFLEGRKTTTENYTRAPKISDGVIFKVLSNLLLLDGERISYRTLDVEQIGSVYETMMGFELDITKGETIALKPAKPHGAPIPVNLNEVVDAKDKSKKLTEISEIKLTDKLKKELNATKTIAEIENILDKRIDRRATPYRLSKGAMVLSPSEARRKSGSHYTPRELTEPIVRTALRPIFERLGNNPKPEEILDLKICDPAMGSGAFLVEACRQLSEKLIESWNYHKTKIQLPPDEDELLYAKRIIAQKCLYGVDKNHMAVNLAKLSLWLVTLAKDHAFSFLDHNLKHGDSLVGLTNKQIMAFDYKDRPELPLFTYMKDKIQEALEARAEIQSATQEKQYDALRLVEESCADEILPLKLVGDLAIKCFFDGKKEKERVLNIEKHQVTIYNYFTAGVDDKLLVYCKKQLEGMDEIIIPFHWGLEFPEVFDREQSGFDCFIGNPPFLGGTKISSSFGVEYKEWIYNQFEKSGNRMDFVAYFLRRCAQLCRIQGTIGLITTNTISQGDTREGGLTYLLSSNNFKIFNARKRILWPGNAAVIVSSIHLIKSSQNLVCELNNKTVSQITPFLLHLGPIDTPKQLVGSSNIASKGCEPLGSGFMFEEAPKENASSVEEMKNLIKTNKRYSAYIFPYLGGRELNDSPTYTSNRYIVDVNDFSEDDLNTIPHIKSLLEDKVKSYRSAKADDVKIYPWWKYWRSRNELRKRNSNLKNVIVTSRVSQYSMFALVPAKQIFSDSLVVISSESYAMFSIVQSSIHEAWAIFMGSSMKDDPRYSATDCFETFPFPSKYQSNINLESIGKEFFDFRSEVMALNNEGATKLYTKFHDPDEVETQVLKLRELHKKLDACVFEAYGWQDLEMRYDFILDYEEEDEDEPSGRIKKKPFRHKFAPELHDEILARLLKLNQERYEEEVRLGLHKKK